VAAPERLREVVPLEVREVCRTLGAAGHQALTVGGAVRDALLGRTPGDWDVATSAHPDQVMALFRKTIPTGLQHGTVTVMVGRGPSRLGVEVTTFRGEGAYSDARRPDSVVFGVPLDEDLARRDFVMNAIAYDPIADELHDPFDGRGDVAARRVRAVGDPTERFTEDGLRVMRAVRFAATLEFALDAATEAAIPAALGALGRVSLERVHDELVKLMAAPRPSVGLAIARRTGVLGLVAPAVAAAVAADGAAAWTWAVVDAADGAAVRVAAVWAACGDRAAMGGADERAAAAGDAALGRLVDGEMRRLKFSNDDRERVVRVARVAAAPWRSAWTDGGVRRVLAGVGRARAADAIALWRAEAAAGEAGAEALVARAAASLAAGEPLAAGELAIGGGDVMAALGIGPGRRIGEVIAAVMERVLDEPGLNTRERLIELVRAM
jgi:tRNA nucleotidyltransferase (CCA-adding enzyme)